MALAPSAGDYGRAIYYRALNLAAAGNGVLTNDMGGSLDMTVTEKGAGADMSVDVARGRCQIEDTVYTEAATVNVAIAAAHATLDRYDLIVYDQDAGNPAAVTGTPSATPVPPDPGADNDIPLAVVSVQATVTVINNADITDVRCFVNNKGKITATYTATASTITNATVNWVDIVTQAITVSCRAKILITLDVTQYTSVAPAALNNVKYGLTYDAGTPTNPMETIMLPGDTVGAAGTLRPISLTKEVAAQFTPGTYTIRGQFALANADGTVGAKTAVLSCQVIRDTEQL